MNTKLQKDMQKAWDTFKTSPSMIYINGEFVKVPIIEEPKYINIARLDKQKQNIRDMGKR